jgi:hypothetical protein
MSEAVRPTSEFRAPAVLGPVRPMPPRQEGDLWGYGAIFAVVVVGALVTASLVGAHFDKKKIEERNKLGDEQYQTIEAGLAIKKKSTSGKKSRLPQKDVAPKVKPPQAPGIATDPNAKPSDEKKDKKDEEYIPPDKRDPSSVFDKYRNVDTGETAPTDGQSGGDDENVEGQEDGSEFGTLERAKGDPYVGELIGRMTKDFTVPSVVTETDLVTWGCVRLAPDGKIKDREIDPDHKSRSHAFNSAVEDRLKKTTDMEQPVPEHLHKLLVEQYACVPFKP